MGYDYYGNGYDVGSAVATGLGAVFGFLIFIYVIALAIGIFSIICNWKVFKKAGKNGWEAIVPVYNIIVLIQIAGLPLWYIALFFVPFANIYAIFKIYIELAKKFGQSAGFGVGLALLNPIFMAILAFGKNYVYQAQMPNNDMMYNQQPMYNQQQPMNNPQQPMYNQQPQQPMNSVPSVCSRCGSPTNPGDRFCMNCGNQI